MRQAVLGRVLIPALIAAASKVSADKAQGPGRCRVPRAWQTEPGAVCKSHVSNSGPKSGLEELGLGQSFRKTRTLYFPLMYLVWERNGIEICPEKLKKLFG